jgi:hypothetical protein
MPVNYSHSNLDQRVFDALVDAFSLIGLLDDEQRRDIARALVTISNSPVSTAALRQVAEIIQATDWE